MRLTSVSERLARFGVDASREPLELVDLLGQVAVDAIVEPHEQHLADDQHRDQRRNREQDHVGDEDPGPDVAGDPLPKRAPRLALSRRTHERGSPRLEGHERRIASPPEVLMGLILESSHPASARLPTTSQTRQGPGRSVRPQMPGGQARAARTGPPCFPGRRCGRRSARDVLLALQVAVDLVERDPDPAGVLERLDVPPDGVVDRLQCGPVLVERMSAVTAVSRTVAARPWTTWTLPPTARPADDHVARRSRPGRCRSRAPGPPSGPRFAGP